MTIRFIIKAVLAAVLTLLLEISSLYSHTGSSFQNRSKSSPVVSEATYNRVLDMLFPKDASIANKPVWSIVLRFKPTFKPESQIVIRRDENKVEVIEYTSPDGSIYVKLNEILALTSKEEAVEMAKAIKVKRREISVHYSQVKRWHTTLFDSIAGTTKTLKVVGEEFDKTRSESFVPDGTIYDLWYEQLLNQMSFSLYDVEIDKPGSDGEFKLVQWMNAVRRDIGKLK